MVSPSIAGEIIARLDAGACSGRAIDRRDDAARRRLRIVTSMPRPPYSPRVCTCMSRYSFSVHVGGVRIERGEHALDGGFHRLLLVDRRDVIAVRRAPVRRRTVRVGGKCRRDGRHPEQTTPKRPSTPPVQQPALLSMPSALHALLKRLSQAPWRPVLQFEASCPDSTSKLSSRFACLTRAGGLSRDPARL